MEKLTKLGITSLSVMALGAVVPLVAPDVFGANVVYAEEQRARTLNVLDRASDANGTYLPTVDLGLSQVVNVTPETPYTVNQPEIEGWERDTVTYTKEGDSSFSKTMKNGDQITYDDLFEDDEGTYGGILIYSYKQPQPASDQPTTPVTPETSTNKPTTGTVIHIGDQPTSPVNETSLYYTIERRFGDPNDGVGWVVEEKPNINAGETHEVEGLSDISKPWTTYRIMEGTPESYTITYDDVKAGKNHFVFRMYNTKTHNPDGTLKTEEKPATPADKPAEQPTKPAEEPQNQERYLTNGYIISGGIERPEGLTSETGTVQTAVTLSPGESYTFPNVTAPGYTLLGIYDGDKNLGVGGAINYDDIPYDSDAEIYTKTVYYIYEPSKAPNPQPETPAEKPADQQPLKYRVTWYMNGKVYRTDEWEIEPGETFTKGYYDKGTVPTYGPVDGTPLSHSISYDDVKAGKTNYDFYIYDTKTQNSDGTPKTEVPANKPETPADKPSNKPVEQPATPVRPMDKPATKPTDTNKPVVNPADNGKPEVKPENKVEPKAEVKPTQQSGAAAANAQTPAPKADTKAPAATAPKADKPADKKMETLPNTGESQSSLALLGLALGVLGLQGLTYKGRHDRKR